MAEHKRGAGRPPSPNPKQHRIVAYVTDAEMERINVLRGEMSLSSFASQLIRSALMSDDWRNEYYTASGQRERDEQEDHLRTMAAIDFDREQHGEPPLASPENMAKMAAEPVYREEMERLRRGT